MVDERVLAERLISYDTSRTEELLAAAGFAKGWLESRDIEVRSYEHNGLPVLIAEVGPRVTASRRASCSTVTWTSFPVALSSSSRGSTATS